MHGARQRSDDELAALASAVADAAREPFDLETVRAALAGPAAG